jgi:5-methylcytosine-specific restriction endonuclease McrA
VNYRRPALAKRPAATGLAAEGAAGARRAAHFSVASCHNSYYREVPIHGRDRVNLYGSMIGGDHRWWRQYDRYLNSRDWQRTRKAVLKRDGYRCRRCGTRGSRRNPLQANHLSYAIYNATGRTPLRDLETLCRRCHQSVTGRRFKNHYRRRTKERWVWLIIIAALLAYALIHGAR